MKMVILVIMSFMLYGNLYAQLDSLMNNRGSVEFIDYNKFPAKVTQMNKITRDDIFENHFDKLGKLKDSILKSSLLYVYDASGNIIESSTLNDKGLLTIKFTYTYNAANKIVKEINEYTDSGLSETDNGVYEFKYDSLGNITYMYDYCKDTSKLRITHRIYSSKGKLIRVFTCLEKKFILTNSLLYNDNGSLQEIKFLDQDGYVASYLYKYDSDKRIKTIYVDDKYQTKFYHEYAYDAGYKCLEEKSLKRTSAFESDTPNCIEKYTYNKDGTIYTDTVYVDGKLKYLVKHYYKR